MYVLAYTYQDNIDSVIHGVVCNSYKDSIHELTQVAQSISDDNNFPSHMKQCLIRAHHESHSEMLNLKKWNSYFITWFDYINSYGMRFNYSIEEFEIGVIK